MRKSEDRSKGGEKEINERKRDTAGEGPGWGGRVERDTVGSAVVSLFPSLTLIQQQRNF